MAEGKGYPLPSVSLLVWSLRKLWPFVSSDRVKPPLIGPFAKHKHRVVRHVHSLRQPGGFFGVLGLLKEAIRQTRRNALGSNPFRHLFRPKRHCSLCPKTDIDNVRSSNDI